MVRTSVATIFATMLAPLLGCLRGSPPAAPELPAEVRELAGNVYVTRGVLHLVKGGPPWDAAHIERVAERTKSFPKISLASSFDGTALASLQRVPNLYSLTICSADPELQSLGNLSQLRELTLTEPVLRQALPHIAGLVQLETLCLTGNGTLADDDLAALSGLEHLERLRILNANVTDTGLKHLAKLRRLQHVTFLNTRATYSGLLGLRELKELEEVYVDSAWLLANDLEAMRNRWPKFRGEAIKRSDSSCVWNIAEKRLAAVTPAFPHFSPDGRRAAQYVDNRLYLMDARKGVPLRELANDCHSLSDGLHFPIAFSADGKWVAEGHPHESLRVWDTATGQLRWTSGPPDNRYAGSFSGAALALSDDGALLAAGQYGEPIRIWDVNRKTKRGELPVESLIELEFLRGGERLLARTGCELRVWERDGLQQVLRIPEAESYALDGDNDVVFAYAPEGILRVHRLSDGATVRSPNGDWPSGRDACVSALSPSGRYLAVPDRSGVVSIWNVGTGKLDHRVQPADGHAPGDRLHAMEFTPDGQYLVLRWHKELPSD